MDSVNNLNLEGVSDADKQELQQKLMHEMQRSQIQDTIHKLTETCFKKCITSKISAPQLDRYEEPCIQNCVQRFMDANALTIAHFEKIRTAGGG